MLHQEKRSVSWAEQVCIRIYLELLLITNLPMIIRAKIGSGKSTLALSFFRFVEPTEGRILVDDVDITKVGLTDLRSRLTIIPRTFFWDNEVHNVD